MGLRAAKQRPEMFRSAQHDTARRWRQRAAACLFEQRPAGCFKRRVRNHARGWRIRRVGVIHPLHLWSKCGVLRLGGSNVYRRADPHECVEFCSGLAVQSNAAMRMRGWMDIALMKTVGGSKLAPITHWIADVTARPTTGGRYYSVALHAEPARSRPLVLLLGINREIASRRGLRSHTNINSGSHQRPVAFHYIDVLLGKRNFHAHSRRIMWLIRGDVIRPAGTHVATGRTTSQQEE